MSDLPDLFLPPEVSLDTPPAPEPSFKEKALYNTGRFLSGDFDWQKKWYVKYPWKATNSVLGYASFLPLALSREFVSRVALPTIEADPWLQAAAWLPGVPSSFFDFEKSSYLSSKRNSHNPELFEQVWREEHNGEAPTDLFYTQKKALRKLASAFKGYVKPFEFDYYKDKLLNPGSFVSALDPVFSPGFDKAWAGGTGGADTGTIPYKIAKSSAALGAFASDLAFAKAFSPKFFGKTASGLADDKTMLGLATEDSFYNQALKGKRAFFQQPIPFSSTPLTITAPGVFKPFSSFGGLVDAYKNSKFVESNPEFIERFMSVKSTLEKNSALQPSSSFSLPVRAAGNISSFFDKIFSRRPKLLETAQLLAEAGLDPGASIRGVPAAEYFKLLSPGEFKKLKLMTIAASPGVNPADHRKALLSHWLKVLEPYIKSSGDDLVAIRDLPSLSKAPRNLFTVPRSYLPFLNDYYKISKDTSKFLRAADSVYSWLVGTFLTPTTTLRNIFSQQPQAILSGEPLSFKYLTNYLHGYGDFASSQVRNKAIRHFLTRYIGTANPSPEHFLSWYLGGNNGFFMQFPALRGPASSNPLKKILNFLPRANMRISEASEKAVRSAFVRQLLKNGYDYLPAAYKTARTFVNYSGLHSWQRALRYIFPFATFSIGNAKNNLGYLANNPFAILAPRLLADAGRKMHADLFPDNALPSLAYDNKYGHYLPLFSNIGADLSSLIPSTSLFGINPSEISSRFASPYFNLSKPVLDAIFPSAGFVTPNKPIYYQQKYGPLFGLNVFNKLLGPRNSDRLTWAFTKNLPFYGWFHNLIYSANPNNHVYYGTRTPSFRSRLATSAGLHAFPSPYNFVRNQRNDVFRLLESPDLSNGLVNRVLAKTFNLLSGGAYSNVRKAQLSSALAWYDEYLNSDKTLHASDLQMPEANRIVPKSELLSVTSDINPWDESSFLDKYKKDLFLKSGQPYRESDYGTLFHEAVQGNRNISHFLTPEANAAISALRHDIGLDSSKDFLFESPHVLRFDGKSIVSGRSDILSLSGIDQNGKKYAYLSDLKFGNKQVSQPRDNSQLLSYALAVFDENPDISYIRINLTQPVPGLPPSPDYIVSRDDIPFITNLIHLLPNSQFDSHALINRALRLKADFPPSYYRDELFKRMDSSPSAFSF